MPQALDPAARDVGAERYDPRLGEGRSFDGVSKLSHRLEAHGFVLCGCGCSSNGVVWRDCCNQAGDECCWLLCAGGWLRCVADLVGCPWGIGGGCFGFGGGIKGDVPLSCLWLFQGDLVQFVSVSSAHVVIPYIEIPYVHTSIRSLVEHFHR